MCRTVLSCHPSVVPAAMEVFELLTNNETAVSREAGLASLDAMLDKDCSVADTGVGTLQTSLLVVMCVSKSEELRRTAQLALHRIRIAGQLRVSVTIPEAIQTASKGVPGKVHTEFVVKVRIGLSDFDIPDRLQCHTVERRYSDFDALCTKVQKDVQAAECSAAFPPKRFFGRMAAEFVEERRQGLELWLESVICVPMVCASDACAKFLGVP